MKSLMMCSLPSNVRANKMRRIRWTGHVARMGERRGVWFWWVNPWEKDHLKDSVVDERIILRWIFRKWDVVAWTGSSWLRIGTCGGHFGCGDGRSVYITCG